MLTTPSTAPSVSYEKEIQSTVAILTYGRKSATSSGGYDS